MDRRAAARSDDVVTIGGRACFPRAAVDVALLSDSATTSFCPWKGVAHYHDVTVDGQVNRDAARHCADPKEAAAKIANGTAFWKGIEVG